MRRLISILALIAALAAAAAEPCRLANVVCFVKFADEADGAWEHDYDYYEAMFNAPEEDANSVFNYFRCQSYGQLEWTSTIVRADYVDSHPRAYFQPKSDSNPDGYVNLDLLFSTRTKTLVKDLCAWLPTALPEETVIDGNGDGEIDNLVLIVYGNSAIGASYMLWPANNRYPSATVFGKRSGNYLMVFDGANGYKSLVPQKLNTGVLCHEMTHTLNAYDLYTSSSSPKTDPVNVWDLMSDNLVKPQGFTAHVRTEYGARFGDWLPAREITTISAPGRYELKPLQEGPEGVAYKIVPDPKRSEYFLLEYRDKRDMWDSGLPASGLLVSRVNPSVNGNLGAQTELYVFRPGGTTDKPGTVRKAPLGPDTGRLGFGSLDDDEYPFYSDGTRALFSLSDIAIGDDGLLSFDYAPVSLSAVDEAVAEGAQTIYTLQGVRIERITEPGTYIVNGKKIHIIN